MKKIIKSAAKWAPLLYPIVKKLWDERKKKQKKEESYSNTSH